MCYKTIIMTFDLRVKYQTCIQGLHILNGNAPGYLNDMFQIALNSHYSLRSGKKQVIKAVETEH